MTWKYAPATKDGQPIRRRTLVLFNYSFDSRR